MCARQHSGGLDPACVGCGREGVWAFFPYPHPDSSRDFEVTKPDFEAWDYGHFG